MRAHLLQRFPGHLTMSDRSKIEWTDATWNPIRGCSRVSEGCRHCYAERQAWRMHTGAYAGLVKWEGGEARWTGKVSWSGTKTATQPLAWRDPKTIFVNSMSDLFHPKVPDAWIDRVFAIMAMCPQHTFQVLTKRAERMRGYCNRLMDDDDHPVWQVVDDSGGSIDVDVPLPNVWLGTSIENRSVGLERGWHLANTPAAVRFWSAEPLLEDLGDCTQMCLRDTAADGGRAVDWVIAGGESGPGARPMHPDWARSLRDQCQAAGVPFFFKQWGEWQPQPADAKWSDFDHIADHRKVCWSSGDTSLRVGRRKAGRLLDGREWNDMPRSLDGNSPSPA